MVKVIYPGNMFRGFSTVDRYGGNYMLTDLELTKRDLLNEFMCPKGARRRNPTFGSIVWNLIFEPQLPSTIGLIDEDLRGIIAKEPRVELVDLEIQSYEHGYNAIISLLYKPTQTVEIFTAAFDQRQILEQTTLIGT